MKTRVITAAVLLPILVVLLFFAETWITAIVLGLLLAVGVYELLYRTRLIRNIRMVCYSAIMAFLLSIWSCFGSIHAFLLLGLVAFTAALFFEMMHDHVKITVETVSVCMLGGFLVPYLISSLVRILVGTNGRFLVPIPFVIAFLSDAGGYFVGSTFGRHKLAPVVSPNKTVEGMLGGLACATVGMIIYALILGLGFHFRVFYGYAILYGILAGLSGVVGDLIFSVIKRQTGIKDYGNLIPGHGGFLDRFDSVCLVAPVVEALLVVMPIALG